MKLARMLLAALLTMSMTGAWAQAPFSPIMGNQPANGAPAAPNETNTRGGTLPYSSQANYSMMEDAKVPQGTIPPSTPSYIGILGEKWETDKRGRRGTFIHNGQEMSVGYDQPACAPKRDTQALPPNPNFSPDSMAGRGKLLSRPK